MTIQAQDGIFRDAYCVVSSDLLQEMYTSKRTFGKWAASRVSCRQNFFAFYSAGASRATPWPSGKAFDASGGCGGGSVGSA